MEFVKNHRSETGGMIGLYTNTHSVVFEHTRIPLLQNIGLDHCSKEQWYSQCINKMPRLKPKKDRKKGRLEFVKYWAEYCRTHSDEDWSEQQAVLIDSQIKNAGSRA